MIQAILFDIDNTLILFDENPFFEAYITKLIPKFTDIFTPDIFRQRLIGATRALLKNQGQTSNVEHYLNHFSRDLIARKQELWNRFNKFYATEFDQLRAMVKVVEGTNRLLSTLIDRGFKLVIASNPLWPLSVQLIRLAWAQVDDLPYSHITHIENTFFCKPQTEYYLDICKQIDLRPEQCLMVGNDPVNDMIAGKTGMKTYLTTDSQTQDFTSFSLSKEIRHQSHHSLPEPDYRGPLVDMIKLI